VANRKGFRRRADPYRIKVNYSYSVSEIADRLGVHKNTVRHWQAKGLAPVDDGRPALFHGAAIREFLIGKKRERKRPCPLGTLYCFRCREPRAPALGMVDYVQLKPGSGNLRALCVSCEAIMHRRVRQDALAAIMPGIDVQIVQAPQRLVGSSGPSSNCDFERQGEA
jgi:hypothetical protein